MGGKNKIKELCPLAWQSDLGECKSYWPAVKTFSIFYFHTQQKLNPLNPSLAPNLNHFRNKISNLKLAWIQWRSKEYNVRIILNFYFYLTMGTPPSFSAFSQTRGKQLLWLCICFPGQRGLSWKKSTLEGKNLLFGKQLLSINSRLFSGKNLLKEKNLLPWKQILSFKSKYISLCLSPNPIPPLSSLNPLIEYENRTEIWYSCFPWKCM